MSNDTLDLESNPPNAAIKPPNNYSFHIHSDNIDNSNNSVGLKTINIHIDRPINLFANNISIYLIDHSKRILRQLFKPDSKLIDIDTVKNTVVLKIIDSVFNIPGATYSLEIDQEFFKYSTSIKGIAFSNNLSIHYYTGI